jgi:hypothetical protein
MDNQSMKAKLINLLHEARTAEQQFIAELSDDERNQEGQPDRWATKDIVSHMTYWQECQVHRLEAASAGKIPDDFADYNKLNGENFEAHRHDSWQQVTERLNNTFDSLLSAVQKLSEADLNDGSRFPWTEGRTLNRSIVGNSYSHPVQHFCDYYVSHGQPERAIQAQEALSEKLSSLGDETVHAEALYNLACAYALSGQSQKALNLLPEAFRLSPPLIAWSLQDTDLVSLREEPAFKALHIT